MKLLKFVLPVMFVAFTAFAADNCRMYTPQSDAGKVVDGTWIPNPPAS